MSRIRKAYEAKFQWLLERARARRVDAGVAAMLERARRLSGRERIPLSAALTRVYEQTAAHSFFGRQPSEPVPTLFFCDAGLGGLARWLRAAGHDALWEPFVVRPVDVEAVAPAANTTPAGG